MDRLGPHDVRGHRLVAWTQRGSLRRIFGGVVNVADAFCR
jgi:hypothetical protein